MVIGDIDDTEYRIEYFWFTALRELDTGTQSYGCSLYSGSRLGSVARPRLIQVQPCPIIYIKVGQPFQNGGQMRLSRAARGPELQTKTQNEDANQANQ